MSNGREDLDRIYLGPVSGFWPVTGIEDPSVSQLWVPKVQQEFESRCLANLLQDNDVVPDVIFGIARGGLMVAQEIAYNNNVRLVASAQTIGYGPDNQPLEKPILGVMPNPDTFPEHIRNGESHILIVDELVDEGEALLLIYGWVREHFKQARISTAVIYDKDKPHVFEPDYSLRKVPNLWLDHESQADKDRLITRMAELSNRKGLLQRAMGWLTTQYPDPDLLRRLVEESEGKYTHFNIKTL